MLRPVNDFGSVDGERGENNFQDDLFGTSVSMKSMSELNSFAERFNEVNGYLSAIPPIAWLVLCSIFVSATFVILRNTKKRFQALENELFWVTVDRNDLQIKSNHDLHLFMDAIEREVANELMRRDRHEYLKLCTSIATKWEALDCRGRLAVDKEFSRLARKYVTYSDFAQNQSWPHVPYQTGFGWLSDLEISEFYADLRAFHALKTEMDKMVHEDDYEPPAIEPISQREITNIRKTLDQLHDADFLAALQDSRAEWEFYSENANSATSLETPKYQFTRLRPEYPQELKRIGVYVKPFDRYGIMGLYLGDHDPYQSWSFYASTPDFSDESHLVIIDPYDESHLQKSVE